MNKKKQTISQKDSFKKSINRSSSKVLYKEDTVKQHSCKQQSSKINAHTLPRIKLTKSTNTTNNNNK